MARSKFHSAKQINQLVQLEHWNYKAPEIGLADLADAEAAVAREMIEEAARTTAAATASQQQIPLKRLRRDRIIECRSSALHRDEATSGRNCASLLPSPCFQRLSDDSSRSESGPTIARPAPYERAVDRLMTIQ